MNAALRPSASTAARVIATTRPLMNRSFHSRAPWGASAASDLASGRWERRQSGVLVPSRDYTLATPLPDDPPSPTPLHSASSLPRLEEAGNGPAHVDVGNRAVAVQVHKAKTKEARARRPLVLIGGLLQTVSTWNVVARRLAATQPVIVYEARGQGATELAVDNLSLDVHVTDFARVINEVVERSGVAKPNENRALPPQIDLGGFSYGGLLSMACAAHFPDQVNKLLLSGVGRRNSTRERVLQEWFETLIENDSLLPLAERATIDSFTPAFLTAHEKTLAKQLTKTAEGNDYKHIKAILSCLVDANKSVSGAEYAAENIAPGVVCPVRLITGEHDKLADEKYVRDLVDVAPNMEKGDIRIVPNVGHASFLQDPRGWLHHAQAFLAEP